MEFDDRFISNEIISLLYVNLYEETFAWYIVIVFQRTGALALNVPGPHIYGAYTAS